MSHNNAHKVLLIFLCVFVVCIPISAQRKTKKKPAPAPPTELTKLREEFVKATSEYKASLTKLVTI